MLLLSGIMWVTLSDDRMLQGTFIARGAGACRRFI